MWGSIETNLLIMKKLDFAGSLVKYEAPQVEVIELMIEGALLTGSGDSTLAPAYKEEEW